MPLHLLLDGQYRREAYLSNEALVFRLTHNGEVFWQESLSSSIPVIAMGVRDQNGIYPLQQGMQFRLREWEFH